MCPHRGQARPGMTRFGEPRKPCPLPAACPHSWLQGAVGAGPRKPASAPHPPPHLPAPVLVSPRQSLAYPSWLFPLWGTPKLRDTAFGSECLPQGLSLCPGPTVSSRALGTWRRVSSLPSSSLRTLASLPVAFAAQKGHTECEGRPQSGHLSSGPCPGCRAAPALCLALYPHTLPWP